MRMRLPSFMDYVKWYGRGEFENYPDRKTAALVGCYATDLNSFVTDYAFPQDNANRCDVRWFSLNDKEGRTIKVTGLQPLCVCGRMVRKIWKRTGMLMNYPYAIM